MLEYIENLDIKKTLLALLVSASITVVGLGDIREVIDKTITEETEIINPNDPFIERYGLESFSDIVRDKNIIDGIITSDHDLVELIKYEDITTMDGRKTSIATKYQIPKDYDKSELAKAIDTGKINELGFEKQLYNAYTAEKIEIDNYFVDSRMFEYIFEDLKLEDQVFVVRDRVCIAERGEVLFNSQTGMIDTAYDYMKNKDLSLNNFINVIHLDLYKLDPTLKSELEQADKTNNFDNLSEKHIFIPVELDETPTYQLLTESKQLTKKEL